MSVLTQAEVDCLLTELDPYVDTEEEREALGLKAFTKYFAEIPGFGERFCTEDEKDLNVVLHSDAVKNLARQAIEHIVEFINAASDTEKLDGYLRAYAESYATMFLKRKLHSNAEPIVIEFYKSILKSAENQAAMERLMKHVFQVVRSYFDARRKLMSK
ncbi:unnamed protein product [Dicrocoelium dendriticum]|nr:unnamed protein product [Dicrocoelium dendriticum]